MRSPVSQSAFNANAERSIQHIIDRKVEHFADLDPGVIDALGGDEFARPPLTVVKSVDEEPPA